MKNNATGGASRRRPVVRIVIASLFLVALSVAGWRLGWFDVRRVAAMIQQFRSGRNIVTASAIYVAILTLTTALGLPVLPIAIAGGAIFGHLLGTTLSWSAAVTGSMLGYALARRVGKGSTQRWFSRHKPLGVELSDSTGFLTLLRLRLLPIVPLSVVNFASGLARVRIPMYLAATALGILPTMTVFSWFADSLVLGLQGSKAHAYRDLSVASVILLLLSLVPTLFRRRAEPA